MRGHILVIDDEKYIYEDLEFGLGQAHYVHYADTLHKINSKFNYYPIDLAVVDLEFKVPGKKEGRFSGLGYIKTLRSRYPTVTIVVLSGYSDEGKIVEATKNGADYYLIKGNFDTDSNEFRDQVRRWVNTKKKLDKKRKLEELDVWGVAEFTQNVMDECQAYFLNKESFLLIGEAGLGKHDLLEHTYQNSRAFRFGKVPEQIDLSTFNVGVLNDLLHHKRGSGPENFLKRSAVKIQYLRNLETLPLSTQESFLKLIRSGKFLDGKELFRHQLVILLDKDPASLIKEQTLSPELANYLHQLRIKPLRERREDLKQLIQLWLDRNGYSSVKVSREAMKLFRHYNYPGNLTELYSFLSDTLKDHQKRFRLDWESQPIQPGNLPNVLHQTPSDLHEEMQYEIARIHLRFIEKALLKHAGARQQKNLAALELNVHSADNLKKTFINKYWQQYPALVKGFPTIVKKYKLDGK